MCVAVYGVRVIRGWNLTLSLERLASDDNWCCLSEQDDGERSLYYDPRGSFLTPSPTAVPVSVPTHDRALSQLLNIINSSLDP